MRSLGKGERSTCSVCGVAVADPGASRLPTGYIDDDGVIMCFDCLESVCVTNMRTFSCECGAELIVHAPTFVAAEIQAGNVGWFLSKDNDDIVVRALCPECAERACEADPSMRSVLNDAAREPKTARPSPRKHARIGHDIGEVVDKKQRAYGDSFGATLELWRTRLQCYDDGNGNGNYKIPHALIGHMLALIRIDDKIMRLVANPDGDLMDENPYQDIAGYAILSVARGGAVEK